MNTKSHFWKKCQIDPLNSQPTKCQAKVNLHNNIFSNTEWSKIVIKNCNKFKACKKEINLCWNEIKQGNKKAYYVFGTKA